MPGPSYIPLEDLIRAARALALGKSLKRTAADLGWDLNRMKRCVTRLDSQVRMEGERHWYVTRETALEWLRMRGVCTPDELERAVSMARQYVVGNLENTLNLGARLQSEGDCPQAERIYLRCLRDDPENVEITAALADCLLEMGRLKEALARFDFALSRQPNDAEVRFGRAFALHRMGRAHDAVADLEIAHRHDPENAHVQAWLALWRTQLNCGASAQDVGLVTRAMAILTREYVNRDDCTMYCCGVTEAAFLTLWYGYGYHEAMAVVSTAKLHGWMTEGIAVAIKRREEARARAIKEAHPPRTPEEGRAVVLEYLSLLKARGGSYH